MTWIWVFIILIILVIIIYVIYAMKTQKERGIKIEENKNTLNSKGFSISKQITDTSNTHSIFIDANTKRWVYWNTLSTNYQIYRFEDLINYEILEDGDSIVKGRAGSTIIGGVLLGGIGALAGAASSRKTKTICRDLRVRIIVNDLNSNQIIIPLINSETKTDSLVYKLAKKRAEEFTALFAVILADVQNEKSANKEDKSVETIMSVNNNDNNYHEIEILHDLMTKGIISQDEFNDKKKKLLGM